jgi:hypothetical protein
MPAPCPQAPRKQRCPVGSEPALRAGNCLSPQSAVRAWEFVQLSTFAQRMIGKFQPDEIWVL